MFILFISKILDIKNEVSDSKVIVFERPENFNYTPGHYGIFEYKKENEIVRRSYSFASSPTEKDMQIIVKRVPNGIMSNYLHSLKQGDTLTFIGPVGKFLLDNTKKDVVFIAGGSGISVFRSMIKYIIDTKSEIKATLIYGSRSPKDIILRDFLEDANRNGFIKLYLTVDHPDETWHFHTGFINADFIKEATNGNLNKVYYLCGPPMMITSVKNALLSLSVPETDIILDAWG